MLVYPQSVPVDLNPLPIEEYILYRCQTLVSFGVVLYPSQVGLKLWFQHIKHSKPINKAIYYCIAGPNKFSSTFPFISLWNIEGDAAVAGVLTWRCLFFQHIHATNLTKLCKLLKQFVQISFHCCHMFTFVPRWQMLSEMPHFRKWCPIF